MRTKVAPEADAFTLATLAGTTGVTTVSAAITSATAFLEALRTAINAFDEAEVPAEDRVLFATPTLLNAVEDLDTTKSKAALASVTAIKVPQTRFYDSIQLLNGSSTGEEAGGYKKATGAKNLNFMLVHKGAVIKFDKHVVDSVIPPEYNNTGDGFIVKYRKYGIVDTYENKVSGIYVHSAPVAP
jgi:hypothetical protein